MKKIEYLTYYNHNQVRNISPKEYNISPKAQSLDEHEYAKTTGNGGKKVLQQKNPHASLQITPTSNTTLKLLERLEWPLQTQTWMGIFHPRNWLRLENQSSTSSHNSQITISQMRKRYSLGLFMYFINILRLLMFPIHTQNSIQFEFGCVLMIFYVSSLSQPSTFHKFEQEPIELLQLT